MVHSRTGSIVNHQHIFAGVFSALIGGIESRAVLELNKVR